jgi:SpoIIAA-like
LQGLGKSSQKRKIALQRCEDGAARLNFKQPSEAAMIEAFSDFPPNVLAFACKGHVSKDDYKRVLVPSVEKALREHEKVRIYYKIGSDFTGIDPSAVWEDMKVGVGHLQRWDRIAVVTDVSWIRHTMSMFGFLLPGEMRLFPMSEAAKARDWIRAR